MEDINKEAESVAPKEKESYTIHIVLFIVTLVTTTIAGAEWMFGKPAFFGEESLTTSEMIAGLYYSLPFLGIFTFHEFGHYLMARYYKIKVTLPYYIPFWLGFLGIPFTIGTMGAFIRMKQACHSRKQFFDIGIAGPLAGFVIAILVLTYGFTHLPSKEHIFEIHPEYKEYGLNYEDYVYDQHPENIALGSNLVFQFFEKYVAEPEMVPNKYEMYHYPWLFAGYLALFFTALNLLPVGQLDGGHVTYGLFGYKYSRLISRSLFMIMITISGIGWIPYGKLDMGLMFNLLLYFGFLFITFHRFESDFKKRTLIIIWVIILQMILRKFFPAAADYGIYLLFSFLLGRFLGVDHPKVLYDKPLDLKRKVLGWIALLVFVISFTPRPLYVEVNEKARIEKPGPEKQKPSSSKIITGRMVEIFEVI